MTTTKPSALTRDAGINALCPPRRVDDDRLYAEWVQHVADTMPARDTYYIAADLNGWDAWKTEAVKVTAWLATRVCFDTPDCAF